MSDDAHGGGSLTSTAGRPRRRRAGRGLVVAAAVALVLVPLFWVLIPIEVARWYQAGALENELDDDYASAVRGLDRALDWCATEPSFWAYRGWLKLKLRDANGALADCQHALQLDPESIVALQYRISAFQRLGNHQAAIADANRLVELASDLPNQSGVPVDYGTALNQRAYVRALANREIAEGLKDIQEALDRHDHPDNAAFLDTRGYLRYLAGDVTGAETDLARAVAIAEANWQAFRQAEPLTDARLQRRQEQALKEELAVLYHHRGLVAEKQGRPPDADQDFRRALEFGYDPDAGVW